MMLWWTSLGTNPCFDYTVAIKVRHYLSNLIGTEVWRNKNQPEARLGNLGPAWGQGKFKPKAWTISRPRSLAEPNNQHEKMRKLCRVAHGQTYAGRSAQYSFISRSILPPEVKNPPLLLGGALEQCEEARWEKTRGKNVPGGENKWCKGPEAGINLIWEKGRQVWAERSVNEVEDGNRWRISVEE